MLRGFWQARDELGMGHYHSFHDFGLVAG